MADLFEILETAPSTLIMDAFVITNDKLKHYDNIMVSISGGADSDIMLDMVSKFSAGKNIRYVFFDTGIEYAATKEHLDYLEQRYNITIERVKAVKPVPLACKQYGQPFVSKKVSNMIRRLQRHNFKWEDKSFKELLKEYPRCKVALKWWCNKWPKSKKGNDSQFNIDNNKWLKEFMIANHPDFFISDECCDWAKKKPAYKFKMLYKIGLSLVGLRKAEGGARAVRYKSCFSEDIKGVAEYRPLFWLKKEDKKLYDETYNIQHSRCYGCYGLERTGCAGCPFGNDFEKELEIIKEHEPKLYVAVNNIFGKSYEYTRKYREFARKKEEEIC